jgi:hypothetical protein
VLALAATAWGDVGHAHGPDEGARAPLAVWLVGIGLTILVAVLVVRQARRRGEYVRRVLGFSLAGGVYALAFFAFYAYFSRFESARAVATRSVPA